MKLLSPTASSSAATGITARAAPGPIDEALLGARGAIGRRFDNKYKWQNRAFRAADAVLALVTGAYSHEPLKPIAPPRRILIVNGGHLGDAIISTAVLPILKSAFRGVEIGFLSGNSVRPVIDGHPLVDHRHYVDHWYLSRSPAPFWRKVVRYYADRRRIVAEIRAHHYDIAIDLRVWFPNFIGILWEAAIPVRIGYDRVGGGPLLTNCLRFRYDGRHEGEYHTELLRLLPIPEASFAEGGPTLPTPGDTAAAEVDRLLAGHDGPIRVLHPCASTPVRDWPPAAWRRLAVQLAATGHLAVFTGRGPRDAAVIDDITRGLGHCVNACDRLSWAGLVELVRRAELVYCVETSVGHIASATGTPVVAIYGGMTDPRHWKPAGEHAVVATNFVPCYPCFRKEGCATMDCLSGLEVSSVQAAAERALSTKRRHQLVTAASPGIEGDDE